MSSSHVSSHIPKHKPSKRSEEEDHDSGNIPLLKNKRKSYVAGIIKLINAIMELIDQNRSFMTLVNLISLSSHIFKILGDSQNYMPPILVPSSTKCIATQILVIAKLNGRKYFILRGFICDIIRPSKELPVQS